MGNIKYAYSCLSCFWCLKWTLVKSFKFKVQRIDENVHCDDEVLEMQKRDELIEGEIEETKHYASSSCLLYCNYTAQLHLESITYMSNFFLLLPLFQFVLARSTMFAPRFWPRASTRSAWDRDWRDPEDRSRDWADYPSAVDQDPSRQLSAHCRDLGQQDKVRSSKKYRVLFLLDFHSVLLKVPQVFVVYLRLPQPWVDHQAWSSTVPAACPPAPPLPTLPATRTSPKVPRPAPTAHRTLPSKGPPSGAESMASVSWCKVLDPRPGKCKAPRGRRSRMVSEQCNFDPSSCKLPLMRLNLQQPWCRM